YQRVLNLKTTKTAQAKKISNLEKRAKRLEKKKKSRTHGLKRLYNVRLSARVESSDEESLCEEDASKQERKIVDIDADKGLTLIDETTEDQGRINNEEMFDTDVLNDEEMFAESADAEQAKEIVADKDLIDDITLAKALMEIKVTSTGTSSRQRALLYKSQEQEQGELIVEEKLRFFVELMDKRKKHFEKLRAEEQRRKPLTKAQKRYQMCIYLKNMVGFTHNQLKNIIFNEVQKAFDKTMSWINSFVPMDSKLVKDKAVLTQESSSKRAEDELDQERSKKQKVKDDKEQKELKQCLEIILDDGDDVTIDATPLSIKTLIIDYKIYKEGKKSYFQNFRADGNSQMYLTFSKMLKNFNREDLEVLWRLVKDRFVKIKLVDDMDSFLLHTLKTMFEHHVEDIVWRNQQRLTKVKNWKLFDSYGVHCVTMPKIVYYLLVEKMYPLTNHTLHQMFNNVKLQVDEECEMAYALLRLVKKQLKEGYRAN
nr:hypothetical protein [Tanacetum cinerariifolium]